MIVYLVFLLKSLEVSSLSVGSVDFLNFFTSGKTWGGCFVEDRRGCRWYFGRVVKIEVEIGEGVRMPGVCTFEHWTHVSKEL